MAPEISLNRAVISGVAQEFSTETASTFLEYTKAAMSAKTAHP
jgi:hypothetical protein